MNSLLESNSLSQNIRKYMKAQNITASELERRTGIPHAVVNILHGRSKNPSFKTVHAIAQQLGCSVEELLQNSITTPEKTTIHHKIPANTPWQAQLYLDTVTNMVTCIQQHHLQPNLSLLHDLINEAYIYGLGSPDMQCDIRFIRWLIDKNLNQLSAIPPVL